MRRLDWPMWDIVIKCEQLYLLLIHSVHSADLYVYITLQVAIGLRNKDKNSALTEGER
jgi:hypothetical protein